MTTEHTDLYAVLGVPQHATQADISHAYRTLLRRHHPDTRVPADDSTRAASDAALAQVLAAYAVLRDDARRADYDREISQPARRQPQRSPRYYRAYDQPPIVAGPVRWQPPAFRLSG